MKTEFFSTVDHLRYRVDHEHIYKGFKLVCSYARCSIETVLYMCVVDSNETIALFWNEGSWSELKKEAENFIDEHIKNTLKLAA